MHSSTEEMIRFEVWGLVLETAIEEGPIQFLNDVMHSSTEEMIRYEE